MKIKRPLIALDFPDGQAALTFLKQFPKDEQLFVKVGWNCFTVPVVTWCYNLKI